MKQKSTPSWWSGRRISGVIKPLSSLKAKSHVHTRLQLRDEHAYARKLLPWIAVLFILFGVVDEYSAPEGNLLFYVGIRVLAVAVSRGLFLLSRGRYRYGFRTFLAVAPFMYVVEYIMISEGLSLSPYFAGLSLILFSATTLFPTRAPVAIHIYVATMAPAILWTVLHPFERPSDTLNFLLMSIGTVLLGVINSAQVYREYVERLVAREALARDLGKREKEVRHKTEELLKRRTFESQFSPQVVKAVLNDSSSLSEMKKRDVVVIVIDIENSTMKAKTLDPTPYKEVVEEVFDVFSSACLKWNVTVDKFTGDGAQAMAGAPVPSEDRLERAMNACADTIRMLESRKDSLQLLWKGPLNVRFSVSEGPALVGFLGRGTLKSFTAIGETVSFAHRLCSTPPPWTVAAFSRRAGGFDSGFIQNWQDWEIQSTVVSGLKGFVDQEFRVKFLKLKASGEQAVDAGRCSHCQTPLVVTETANGLPKVFCPGCESRHANAA
ncbi:MAG TPA: adenylate/guanylate cyclase domain-containing protein [Bdellovibrionota bacterium]|nr:adenylate/guanylate cyclase domain-containing protein [Bdellovibrionota bacterium]